MKFRIPALLPALAATALLYWPLLHAAFLFDDIPNLSALSSIAHVASWRDLGIYLSQPRDSPAGPWPCSASCCRNPPGRTTRSRSTW